MQPRTSLHTPRKATCATWPRRTCSTSPRTNPSSTGTNAQPWPARWFSLPNGIEILDPAELLYDVMIKVASKEIGKPQIAAALRSLLSSSDF